MNNTEIAEQIRQEELNLKASQERLETLRAELTGEPTHKRGERWVLLDSGEEYVLACVGDDLVALIGIDHGNRYHSPVVSPDVYDKIPHDVFLKCLGGSNFDEWKRVTNRP